MARAAATPAPGAAAVRMRSGAGLSSGSESPEERRSSRQDRSKKGRKEKRSKRSKRSRDREDRERERDRTSKKAKPTQDGRVSSSCRHHCQKGMGSPHCQAGILCSKTFERPLQDLGQEGKRTQAAKVSPSTAGVGTILPTPMAHACARCSVVARLPEPARPSPPERPAVQQLLPPPCLQGRAPSGW